MRWINDRLIVKQELINEKTINAHHQYNYTTDLMYRDKSIFYPNSDLADGLSEVAAAYWGSRPLQSEIAQCALSWLQSW